MKYEKLKSSAEQITMPDKLKERILDSCEALERSGKNQNDSMTEHVFTVEHVQPHPIRRAAAGIAACAVLAGGIGFSAHLISRSGMAEPSTDFSEYASIVDSFDGLLSREFKCVNGAELTDDQKSEIMEKPFIFGTISTEFTDEQRREIIDIIAEYEWTEISEEEYYSNGIPDTLCYLEAMESASQGSYYYWNLIINKDGLARFYFCISEYTGNGETTLTTITSTNYKVNSEDLAGRIMNVIAHKTDTDESAKSAPFGDISDMDVIECLSNGSGYLPQDEVERIAEFFNGQEWTPVENSLAGEYNGSIAYSFLCQNGAGDLLIYINRNGIVVVDGSTNGSETYAVDYDLFNQSLGDILYGGGVFGDAAPMGELSEKASLYCIDEKAYSGVHLLSDEQTEKMVGFFRSCYWVPIDGVIIDFDLVSLENSIEFYAEADDTVSELIITADGRNIAKYAVYVYQDGSIVSETSQYYEINEATVREAYDQYILETGNSYPSFGTLWKSTGTMDYEWNGQSGTLGEAQIIELSDAFFGYDWSDYETVYSFLDAPEPIVLTFAVDGGTRTIRVYPDGTVEWSDIGVHVQDSIPAENNIYMIYRHNDIDGDSDKLYSAIASIVTGQ